MKYKTIVLSTDYIQQGESDLNKLLDDGWLIVDVFVCQSVGWLVTLQKRSA